MVFLTRIELAFSEWKSDDLPLIYRNIIIFGTPNGIRTRVPAVKEQYPEPLDDRSKTGIPSGIRTRICKVKAYMSYAIRR